MEKVAAEVIKVSHPMVNYSKMTDEIISQVEGTFHIFIEPVLISPSYSVAK
jgi:hypothetical protein